VSVNTDRAVWSELSARVLAIVSSVLLCICYVIML